MQVVDNSHIICFDVDDTLVMWLWDQAEREKHAKDLIEVGKGNFKTLLLPHFQHIELLKRYKAKGKVVIVWSQSGNQWAEEVVKALKLEEFVDFVFTKPEKYVDDLRADECMEWVYKGKPNDSTPHN